MLLKALQELKDLIQAELQSLAAKIETQQRQVKFAETELENIRTLVRKGNTARPRELEVDKSVASFQSDLLDMETAVLRAKQELSKADRDALDLRNNNASQVLTELQETEAKLDELRRHGRQADFMRRPTISVPALAGALTAAQRRPPKYSDRPAGHDRPAGEDCPARRDGASRRRHKGRSAVARSEYRSTAVDHNSAAPIIGAGVLGGRSTKPGRLHPQAVNHDIRRFSTQAIKAGPGVSGRREAISKSERGHDRKQIECNCSHDFDGAHRHGRDGSRSAWPLVRSDPSAPPAAAITANDFIDLIAVNVHVQFVPGKYADIGNVISALEYLGVHDVPDAAPGPTETGPGEDGKLAEAGIKLDRSHPGGSRCRKPWRNSMTLR